MLAKEIIDQTLDRLRDINGRQYSRSAILGTLREALRQYIRESSLLKYSIKYTLLVGKSTYSLPEGLTNFPGDWDFATTGTGAAASTLTLAANNETDFGPGVVIGTGSLTDPGAFYRYLGDKRIMATAADQTITFADAPATGLEVESILIGGVLNSAYWATYKTPRYLKAIRFSLLSTDGKKDRILTPNSEFERDSIGLNRLRSGVPSYIHNDNKKFFSFGIWPSPDANCVANNYDSILLDYVRDAAAIEDEDSVIDPELPEQFLDKLYTLVCFLRLNGSTIEADRAQAPVFLQLYQAELLGPTLMATSHIDRYDQLRVKS